VVSTDTNRVVISENVTATGQQYARSDAAREPLSKTNALRQQTTAAGVLPSVAANSVLGSDYAVGYAPVEGTDWVVVAQAPRSSVFGFVQAISNWGLFVTIAAVLLTDVTGTWVQHLQSNRQTDRQNRADARG
jgi:hypothetical protein